MIDFRAYAQLVRLPNLPTAWADICLAALAAGALPGRWLPFFLLLLTSGCLYCAGMVWNDFFDVAQDQRERPFRPIPSGRIHRRTAGVVGSVLVLLGLGFALLTGWVQVATGQTTSLLRPVVLASLLVAAIFLYDGWLKRTWLGPLAMGSCRFFNVLLGLTIAGSLPGWLAPHLALVVGLYIVGVTWLARTEARISNQPALLGAAALMGCSLALAVALPQHTPPGQSSVLFLYLLVGLGVALTVPIVRAIQFPTPPNVQAAVKRSLMALIVLDAILATALAGMVGLLILLLLLPSLYLNRRRWLYAT